MDLRTCATVAIALLTPALATAAGFEERKIGKQEIREVTASSTSDGKVDGRAGYAASYLIDGVAWTPWGEGVLGDGVGEKIRLELGGTRYLTSVGIVNGNGRDMNAWREHGRARRVIVRYRGGEQAITPKNAPDLQVFSLGAPRETDFVELEIAEVFAGGHGPLSLSEVQLFEPADVLALKPEMRQVIEEAMGKLGDPNAGAQAAKALAGVGAPAIPWLVALKGDPNPATRQRVAQALGDTGAPAAWPVLKEIYERSTEEEVRREVLVALRNLRSGEAAGFLGPIAEGDDPEMARLALLAMEGIGDGRAMATFLKSVIFGDEEIATIAIRHLGGFGPEAVKGLGPFLRDGRIAVRARAVWALGRAGGPESQAQLLQFIKTGEVPIVLAGLKGLGETGAPEAFDILADNADHEMVEIRKVIARTMGGFPNTQAAAVLDRMIRTDADAGVVEAAWQSLGRLGPASLALLSGFLDDGTADQRERALTITETTPGAGPVSVLLDRIASTDAELRQRVLDILNRRPDGGPRAIAEALGHEDSAVRFAAARLLVTMGPQAVEVLNDAATDSDDPAVRVAALRCLAEVGDPLGSKAVIVGMGSSNHAVRREAVRAAARIPSDHYVDRLIALLDDSDDQVRLGVVEALGGAKAAQAVQPLAARLEAGDRNAVRIIWALGEMRDVAAVPALAAQFTASEPFTRQVVVEALGKIGGNKATGLLMEAMVDPDASVRKKAELALNQ